MMYNHSYNGNATERKAANRNMQEAASQRKAANDTQYFWDLVRRSMAGHFVGPRKFSRTQEEHHLFGKKDEAHAPTTIEDSIEVQRSGPRSDEVDVFEAFSELEGKVPTSVLSCFQMMHFHKPTPIQKHAIPLGLHGLDLMCCAQTGSGKTFAFLVPVVAAVDPACARSTEGDETAPQSSSASTDRVSVDERGVLPRAVILAPTRELASQIHLDARRLTLGSATRTVCVYGGNDIRNQLVELCTGCELIVATPGRLNDLVERGVVSLSQVSFLVLDEADRMLDMGFEPQIRRIVLEYDMPHAEARQTFLFSATFPSEIQALAREFLRNYVWIAVGRVGSTVDNIKQQVLLASSDPNEKIQLLIGVLDQTDGRTLVFVQKKRTASWLCDMLRNVYGIAVEEIHGDRTQAQRENALKLFRDGKIRILIATDVAARGLDVPAVTHVVQFDMPLSNEDFDVYVHRIGRTGRAGKAGLATSFFVPGKEVGEGNGKIATQLVNMLRENNQEIPEWLTSLNEINGGYAHAQNRRPAAQGRPQGKFGFHDTRANQQSTVYPAQQHRTYDYTRSPAPTGGGYYQHRQQPYGQFNGTRQYYSRTDPHPHSQFPQNQAPHNHVAMPGNPIFNASTPQLAHSHYPSAAIPSPPPSVSPSNYSMHAMPSGPGYAAQPMMSGMHPSQYPPAAPYYDPYNGYGSLDAQMSSLSLAKAAPPTSMHHQQQQSWSMSMNPMMMPPRPMYGHDDRNGSQYNRAPRPGPAQIPYADSSYGRPSHMSQSQPSAYNPYHEQMYAQQSYGGSIGSSEHESAPTNSTDAPSDVPQ